MNAFKEIEKLIDSSNYTNAKKTWLAMELVEMNTAKEHIDNISKEIFEEHGNNPEVKMISMINGFKDKLINSLKDQVEAEEAVINLTKN